MFQFNGWIVLHESPEEIDCGSLREITQEVRQLINSLQWGAGVLDVKTINAQDVIVIAGLTNHRGSEASDLERLILFVAERAPGSFGIVYVWDDEDQMWPGPNAFKVLVLARGKLLERADPFLSPVVPVLSDD